MRSDKERGGRKVGRRGDENETKKRGKGREGEVRENKKKK